MGSNRPLPATEGRTELRHALADAFAEEPELAGLSDAARRVLAVAGELFFVRGAAATSVRDITTACGLSPGALYNHFRSRDDLLYVLVRTGHVRTERALDAALAAAGPSSREQLGAFVEAYTAAHLRMPEFARLVRREYLHLSEPRRQEIVERRRAIREQLVDILRAGQSDGTFDLIEGGDGSRPQAMMILDMCSRTSDWYTPHSPRDSELLTARYRAAALRMIGAADLRAG